MCLRNWMRKEGCSWKSEPSLPLICILPDRTNIIDSERDELDMQLRAVPEIERRIAELTAGLGQSLEPTEA